VIVGSPGASCSAASSVARRRAVKAHPGIHDALVVVGARLRHPAVPMPVIRAAASKSFQRRAVSLAASRTTNAAASPRIMQRRGSLEP
jgi:hypothetical protein